ncbi:hypothetical protein D9M69_701640 [compost metagenome]
MRKDDLAAFDLLSVEIDSRAKQHEQQHRRIEKSVSFRNLQLVLGFQYVDFLFLLPHGKFLFQFRYRPYFVLVVQRIPPAFVLFPVDQGLRKVFAVFCYHGHIERRVLL